MSRLDYMNRWLYTQKVGDNLALIDYKITAADEEGKLNYGQPVDMWTKFQTYQEMQQFLDSYNQMAKDKHNGLIDEVSQQMEQKADKTYKGDLPVSNILDIPFSIHTVRYQVGSVMPTNAPAKGTSWSTIETKPCSSVRYLELYWFNWGHTPAGNMFSAILDTESKIFVSNWKEIGTTDKIDILSTDLRNGWTLSSGGLKLVKVGKCVTVIGTLLAGTLTKGTTILILPTGYIPLEHTLGVVHQYANPTIARIIRAQPDGTLKIESDYDFVAGTYMFNFSYII